MIRFDSTGNDGGATGFSPNEGEFVKALIARVESVLGGRADISDLIRDGRLDSYGIACSGCDFDKWMCENRCRLMTSPASPAKRRISDSERRFLNAVIAKCQAVLANEWDYIFLLMSIGHDFSGIHRYHGLLDVALARCWYPKFGLE